MKFVAILMLLSSPLVALCQTSGNIMQLARQDDSLSQFVAFADQLDLTAPLSEDGSFTVFAPTNSAFDSFSSVGMSNEELTDLLLLHVHNGTKIPRNQVGTGGLVMANGIELSVYGESNRGNFIDNVLTIGSVGTNVGRVRGASLDATNGIVHKINSVLIPPLRRSLAPSGQRSDPPPSPTPGPGTKSKGSSKGSKGSSKGGKRGRRAHRRF